MKKYFKMSTFYQGDGSILLPLLITYIAAFIVNLSLTSNYFNWTIRMYLYNQSFKESVLNFGHIVFLIIYISVVYIITVGIFKRKKWSTLLAGPFSRMDIRKREFFIISFSTFVYLISFLISILRGWCKEKEILCYMGDFNVMVVTDTIRLIGIAIMVIGVIAILDSIFSNIYFLFGSIIFSFVYLVFLYGNFGQALSYYKNNSAYGIDYVINGVMEYAEFSSYGIENSMTSFQVILISIAIIILGSILIFIAKKLTSKMLVENMNEGIIFNFPKKIARFLIVTLPGLVVSLFLSGIIYSIYFRYDVGLYKIAIVRLVIILGVSIISYFILKKITIKPKEIYRL